MKAIEMKNQSGVFVKVSRWAKFTKRFLIVFSILYLVGAIHNPAMLIRHKKAFGRYMERRDGRIKYAMIKETKGELFANYWDCGNTWADFGRDMKKMGSDFMSLFNRG